MVKADINEILERYMAEGITFGGVWKIGGSREFLARSERGKIPTIRHLRIYTDMGFQIN
jgi:hypothetical protein